MSAFTSYIPQPVDPVAIEMLSGIGDVVLGYGESPVSYEAVASKVNAVLLRSAPVTAAHMDAAPGLRIVARHGVGLDTVDLPAATARGIAVTVTAGTNARSVAEHVFALLLGVARMVPAGDAAVRAGRSSGARPGLVGFELHDRTLGILGFGNIGRQVARIALDGFSMDVVAHDPAIDPADIRSEGVEPVDLATLFARSQALSIHLPLTESTRGMVGDHELAAMPAGAVVVNTARGGVVDEYALVRHLESGHLGGAGLDVVAAEPLDASDPLAARPDVVLTPHVGGQTAEAMRRTAVAASKAIIAVHAGERPDFLVNPEILRTTR